MASVYNLPTFGPDKFGATLGGSAVHPDSTQTTAVLTASPDDHGGHVLHPSNPLLAFGAIAAVVFGLMAVSTSASVRVGHTRAATGISIGDTK